MRRSAARAAARATGHGDERQERLGQRLREGREEAHGAGRQEADDGDGPTTPAADPEQAGQGDRGAHDQDVEGELVGLAEELDEELLAARRLVGDDEVADGQDEGWRSGEQPGHELADGDAQRSREATGREGRDVSRARGHRSRRRHRGAGSRSWS